MLLMLIFACSCPNKIISKQTDNNELNRLQRVNTASDDGVGGGKAFVHGKDMKLAMKPVVSQLRKEEAEGSADEHKERAQPSMCPLSKDLDRPEPVPELSRCPEYRESSCCSKQEDDLLNNDFISAYEYIYNGCPGCLENFRLLQCAMKCSPDQRDFVTNEQGGRVVVRMCPDMCHRFFASCVNTTARKVFHADDGTFCADQNNNADGTELVVDQYSCINAAGPSYCNGEYIHEVESDDGWSTKQIVKVSVVASLTIAVILCCLYKMCCQSEEDDLFLKESVQQHPYHRPTLFIPGDEPKSH